MRTLVASPFEDDALELIDWAYGTPARYQMQLWMSNGQRVGQAFMNALFQYDRDEYQRIKESDVNPFYLDQLLRLALEMWTTK